MENNFKRFGTMIDCSRNAVMNVDTVKNWIDLTADLGYNTFLLYIEDTYEIKSQPYFGHLRGRYSEAELKEIDNYAAQKNTEFIPCIQTLAHLNAIFHWKEFADVRDLHDTLLVGDQKVYGMIDDMFKSIKNSIRGNIVHIGMDKAGTIGRGRYLDINGYTKKYDILKNHLAKVSQIAEKYGLTLVMWGDMFARCLGDENEYYDNDLKIPDYVKNDIPDNVYINYWDYYHFESSHYDKQIKIHNAIKDNSWFAGGLWTWVGFVPRNSYSITATKAAFKACRDNNVQNVFLTLWGDDGAECSKYAVLPSLYYSAQLAKGIEDEEKIKAGFKEKYGIGFDDFMLLDIPGSITAKGEIPRTPDKYFLYCDCFMGQFDYTVKENGANIYAETAGKLEKLEGTKDYGYLFSTISKLCSVIAVKYGIGVKTRELYLKQDKEGLKALLADYDRLILLVDRLYEAVRYQWMKENKPQGFEVLDIRFGGLSQRIKHCKKRISDYISGDIDKIEELNEPVLNYVGSKDTDTESVFACRWNSIVTANNI